MTVLRWVFAQVIRGLAWPPVVHGSLTRRNDLHIKYLTDKFVWELTWNHLLSHTQPGNCSQTDARSSQFASQRPGPQFCIHSRQWHIHHLHHSFVQMTAEARRCWKVNRPPRVFLEFGIKHLSNKYSSAPDVSKEWPGKCLFDNYNKNVWWQFLTYNCLITDEFRDNQFIVWSTSLPSPVG